MNLLSYYKTWSSHARWWMLLVGGVCSWTMPDAASEAAGRPGSAPTVQSAPVEAPQLIEIVPPPGPTAGLPAAPASAAVDPQAPVRLIPSDTTTSSRRVAAPVSATAPAVPLPSGRVAPSVPVPVGASRSDQPAVRSDQPAVRSDQPAVRSDQPALRSDQPSAPVAKAASPTLPAATKPAATTVAAPAPSATGSSRRQSPAAPPKPVAPAPAPIAATSPAPALAPALAPVPASTIAKPAVATPAAPVVATTSPVVARPVVAPKLEPQPAAPAAAPAAPVTASRPSLEPIAAAPPAKPEPQPEVKAEPKAELHGFAKAPVKPAAPPTASVAEKPAEAPAVEIPSETPGEATDRIEATPFPGELSQAERMAGEESLPPVLDAETARRMLAEKRAAEAAEAARRRVVERQAMEAAAAQEAAKLLRPVVKPNELATSEPAQPAATTSVAQPEVRRPVLGPEPAPRLEPTKPTFQKPTVQKPSVPVYTASTSAGPAPAMLPSSVQPVDAKTIARPASTDTRVHGSALPSANAPARIATKPAEPAFRDRGPTPAAAELKRDAFQPAGTAAKPAMQAAGVPQLAQVPGAEAPAPQPIEAQPIVPDVPPPAVPVPGLPADPAPAIPPVPAAPGVPRVAPADPAAEAPADDGNPILSVDEHFTTVPVTGTLEVQVRRSILIRCKSDIYRTAVVDPQICDVVQFTPREISIIGKGQGATNVTFWFNDGRHQPVNYVVRVKPDLEERRRLEGQYKLLQDILREQFPDSKVYLIPVADKLIVKGQARDAEEAASIMAVIRGQTSTMGFRNQSQFGLSQGSAAQVLAQNETGRQPWPRIQVINLLRVPGIHQVALRVKIAELNRSAARGFGVDVRGVIDFNNSGSGLLLSSILNAATGTQPALIANFSGDDIQIGVRYLQQHGVIRVLSEPTLVTMSGQPATFVAGGEFAVPTLVGSAGVNAVTTDFRAYGAIVSFMPTVLDKDRIRLQVAPEFSQINTQNTVNGIPGTQVRAVTTTVEMREGQTLAIAGLLDDSMKATNVGDLPLLANIFGRRDITRNETELIILVTPELIQPMEPEEVPPLPGFDVTEPNNRDFFWRAQLEGNPTREYRSTIWHRLRSRYTGGGSGMISGPFGHGN